MLRLAFCGSEELRERFVRAETALFKLRWETDDVKERKDFQASLNLGFEQVRRPSSSLLSPAFPSKD